MSLPSTVARLQVLITGLPQTVPVFEFNVGTDLLVLDGGNSNQGRDPADVLTLGSDYTVSGGGYNSANEMQPGSIEVVGTGMGLVQVGDFITILRGITPVQDTSFVATGPRTPLLTEQNDDNLTAQVQQIEDLQARCLTYEKNEGSTPILYRNLRSGMLLGFDSSGNIQYYSPADSTPGDVSGSTVTATGGTNARTLAIHFNDIINVKDFGATGDGVTDDTVAITAAWNYARTLVGSPGVGFGRIGKTRLLFPPGIYLFNGPALDAPSGLAMEVVGAGRGQTQIQLGVGIYFIATTGIVYSLTIQGFNWVGGLGCWKHSSTSTNVQGEYIIQENVFGGYTEAAIATLSSDMPYFKIRNNVFYGTTASKGVALGGASDMSKISSNAFLRNRYHLKLANGAQNVKILENDFIRYTSGGGSPVLTDIWIVPNVAATNGGQGCEIEGNKFGNENISTTDYRILVADQGAGTDFASKNNATTVSTGYWVSPQITRNYVASGSNFSNGFIYSYTARVYDYLLENVWIDPLPSLIQFNGSVTYANDNRIEDLSVIRATGFFDGSEQYIPPFTTRPGASIVDDPFGYQQGNPDSITKFETGFDPGFTNLGSAPYDTGNVSLVSATKTSTVDALGGANASEIIYSATNGYAYVDVPTTNMTPGRRAWMEVDLKAGSVLPVNYVEVQITDGSTNIAVKRFFTVPADWTTIRIPWVPRQTASPMAMQIVGVNYSNGVRERVKIGRIRTYHANEPQNPATMFLEALKTYDPPSLNDGARASTTLTVTGAALGDFVKPSFSLSLQGILMYAEVTSSNTVTVYLQNNTGGVLDINSGTLRARCYHPTL